MTTHHNHVGPKSNACGRHLTPEELENNIGGLAVTDNKLRELFNSLDTSGNGTLSPDEIKEYIRGREHYGLPPTEEELNKKVASYHKGSGEVTFEEFAAIVLHLARY